MAMTPAQQSAAVAEAHYQWVQRNLDNMPFDPTLQTSRPDDDYNQHNLTMSCSPEQQADLDSSIAAALKGE
jgi:hypothetical protein